MEPKSITPSRSPNLLYAIPIVLFASGLFFQLVVLPSSFTASHFDVLGVRELASVEEVVGAYEGLLSKWNAGLDIPTAADFIKIRYAYELLTNPLLKRDYEIFSIDEQLHIIETLRRKYEGSPFSKVPIPLLNDSLSESTDKVFGTLTTADFFSDVGKNETWLIQVCSSGSQRCAKFSKAWTRVLSLLDGIVKTGSVELGHVEFASFLAERMPTGKPFFRNGLPSFVAFSPNCRSSQCYRRYNGDLSVDAIIDWIAKSILGLPRILYYSRETLLKNLLAKSGYHKNKIIIFSETGERAPPFIRLAARDYWAYAAFGLVLWKEEESSVWRNMLGVESAPAIVLLKENGVKPIVYHGSFNRSWLINILEENKHQDLPQLRSITSAELGCDSRGYSRAGSDTLTWYCVVVAGRPSPELNSFRETLRSARKALIDGINIDVDQGSSHSLQFPLSAADALKEKRLTFSWLDGEAQSQYCLFYVHSETSYETCGPRRHGYPIDVPKLFIIRYKRNLTEDIPKAQNKKKSIWDEFQEEDANLASQLVAKYNGSDNFYEVIRWISQIIDDGDKRKLPYFRANTPELIPEDKDLTAPSSWSSISGDGAQKVKGIVQNMYDRMADPRLGPLFMLAACISFSTIWLKNNRTTQCPEEDGYDATATHEDPPDAYQALSSDSEAE